MSRSRIKINTASLDEIATLYDIGKRRAESIISYRDSHGPFRGPEDLAKVRGVPYRLALTLSDQIDWEIPFQHEEFKNREITIAINWLVVFLTLSCLILSIILEIFSTKTWEQLLFGPGVWLKGIIAILGVTVIVCFIGYAASHFVAAMSLSRERARRFSQIGLLVIASGLFFGILLLINIILYIHLYYPSGWNLILFKHQNWIFTFGLICFLLLYFLIIPQLIVWKRPHLINDPWLALMFDGTIILFGLLLILSVRLSIGLLPFWVLILVGTTGIIISFVAIFSIRRGESFFHVSLDFIDPRILIMQRKETDDWRTWLSSRIPDSDQQKLLKKALNEIYPSSAVHTFIKFLIFVIGGWLFQTVVAAIIELYIQNWMETWMNGNG